MNSKINSLASVASLKKTFRITALTLSSACLVGLGIGSNSIAQAGQVSCNSRWAADAIGFLEDRVGFRVPFVFCHEIDAGDSESLYLTFTEEDLRMGRNHLIVGECDQDCDDLDITVYDDRGRVLGEDFSFDSFAQVRLNNVYLGQSVRVDIDMYDCSTDYCGVAIGTVPVR